MKILVTGGGGMLGKSLQKVTKNFNSNDEYIFLTRSDGDLRKWDDVEKLFIKYSPSIVIHLASHVGGVYDNLNNNFIYLMDNTIMHYNIINMCKKYNVKKIINILSTCIFPDKDVTYPLTSEQLHNGLPHYSNIGYAYSKRFLQVGSSILCNTNDTSIVNLIPTNLYGEHDNYNLEGAHVIPALIHKTYLAKQNNTPLYIKGSGNGYRQFLYIDDLANLIIKFIHYNTNKKEITCITSPSEEHEIQIKDIVNKIVNKLDFTGNVIYDTSYSDGQLRKTTTNKEVLEYLGDFEFTGIESGMNTTIQFFIENYNTIRK